MPETQGISALRTRWTAPTGMLGILVEEARARAKAGLTRRGEWVRRAEEAPRPPSLRAVLRKGDVAIIAEVKRRSPSKGAINTDIDARQRARSYVEAGASAVSVLTEPDWFGGSMEDLSDVAAGVEMPVLRKDFIVAPVQLFEARACGAAGALLIARALRPKLLCELHDLGRDIGLELLVEVRDEFELDCALEAGATIIGVNNRNLETLVIDPATVERMIPLIPRRAVAVAESGMSDRADIERAAACGADAILIGSAVSSSPDPHASVRALLNVRVERDARPD
ncbi:MAG: indole-3-glycerol-phosphate synthase [Gemmatimonadaceae bacterium]